ncbi:MAG: nucleotidyltransferase domain-containing protein [Actinobacteria bacterium]|nr:nucleotidyltransferase domain-containing protein [Actinomycetota bacterium]
MKINRPLDQLFTNEARIQILRTLFKFPGEFTGRHISRLSSLPHATSRLNLKALEGSDILTVKHVGRSNLYSLNKNNILYQPLAALFEAEQSVMRELEGRLTHALRDNQDISNKLIHASLYGSIVKEDESPDSDIDLFLLFKDDIDKSKLDELLDPVREEVSKHFGNHLHIMSFYCNRRKNCDELLSLNLVKEVAHYGKKLYGEDLEEVLDLWQKEQRQRRHIRAKKNSS